MKKLITTLIGLFAIINLNAQEPQIKFYLNDGAERTYNISDVEEMSFIKSDVFSYMSIYFTDSTKRNFDTKSIEKMEISEEYELLSIYTCGYPYNYEISTIDSIIFGYDIEGLYETITIGNQVWMKYNLDVCHYRNGDPILLAQTQKEWNLANGYRMGAWCYYNNNSENGKIYGKMYNWHAVNDERGLAPEGWRMPSDEDWTILTENLGGTEFAGAKLAGGVHLWVDGNLRNYSEFNSSKFRGLPGGYRHYDGSFTLRTTGYWWSSTEYSQLSAIYWFINYKYTNVNKSYLNKLYGISVRCIKDE